MQHNMRAPQWDIITVPAWTDSGAVDTSKILEGKRQRKTRK